MSNFKYYESDYEEAFLELLTENNWNYKCGYDLHREKDDIILIDEFSKYLNDNYGYLTESEINELVSYLTSSSDQSLYRAMKKTYTNLFKGYNIKREDGTNLFINFIDQDYDKNYYTAVNQYEYEEYHNRRPDIVLFINGIPVSIIELKNLANEKTTIKDAYDQTHIRYAQDIPSLMKFDFINVISDGANTKYGSLFSSYKFYFKWNSTDGINYSNYDGIDSMKQLINGLYSKENIIKILQSYIYFPDNSDNDTMIIPKYYQYYGSEAMFKSILRAFNNSSSKGGTYWGATGCGKSYIMLFLAKRITTCIELNKPTIVFLTDRNDLDDQLSDNFENAKNYLIDDNSINIPNRKVLKEKLENVPSGGIYLLTIQKFSEDINLLSQRNNIICVSDEAHRTQTNINPKYVLTTQGMKKTYGFAKYLRDSFPNAIYVGFTGTPVDATLNVFGDIICKYTMQQSVADGSTVKIERLSGPREVQLDEKLAEACDKFYALQQKEGANEYQIEESKRKMSKVKVILGSPSRLDIVVKHFIWHYENRCEEGATVNQKAMFVCYDRDIAFEVYKRIKELRPEWFIKRKVAPEYEGQEDRDSIECEKVKLICTNGKNDTQELKDLIGTSQDRKKYAKIFKDVKSNFKIAIVVDMWVTGFDVPSLDTMYIDKPLETHNLIQTISRVNRVFEGKSEGLIVDYIGLENSILNAMKLYNGDLRPINGIESSLTIFKDFLAKTDDLMNDFNFSAFFNKDITPLQRLDIIQRGVEYVMKTKMRESQFMGYTLRAKKAYNICVGHPDITEDEVARLNYYICIRSVIYKMTKGDTPDATLMNQKIKQLVDRAISSVYDGKDFDFANNKKDDVQNIFSDEFIEKLKQIKYPNTRYQALIKLLKKAISNYSKTNILKASVFSKRLKQVIEKYNTRNEIDEGEEIIDDFVNDLSKEVENIYRDLKKEEQSFKNMDITFDEKAFYDILVEVAKRHNFYEKINEEKYIYLAKEIKKLVSNKSKYTDWTNRQDVKDELQFDVRVLLNKNGYPPEPSTEAYDEIMKQVENFKKFDDVNYDDSEEYDESVDDVDPGEFNNESNITNGFSKDENILVSEPEMIYNTSEENKELQQVAEDDTEFNLFEGNIGKFKTNSGRNIYYYGEEFGDSIKSINGNEFSNIKTLNDLFAILLKSWKRETAYPSCKRDPQYNLDNDPTYGQCAITAIIVYDLFGGTIHRIRVNGGGTHYFNKINGHYIDLTRDQFDLYNIPVSYEPNETMNREYCGKNPDTAKRLEILLSNMKENN